MARKPTSRLPQPEAGHCEGSELDLLTALLEPCHFRCRLSPPRKLTAAGGLEIAQAPPGFYLILEGSCVLELDDAGVWSLDGRDLAIVTRTSNLRLRDATGSAAVPARRLARPDEHSDGRVRNRADAITRVLCGEFVGDDDYTRQTIGLLPEILILRDSATGSAGSVRAFIETLLIESDPVRPGSEILCNRVLQILLIHAFRETSSRLPDTACGLLAVIRIPGLRKAMGAMHARPDHDWTVQELADLAGMSRAAFAVRFLEIVGVPPFQYLREVRMRLSCRLLSETEMGIKEITARVGYSTDASFTKAFTRWSGQAPGEYRRQVRGRFSNSPHGRRAAAPG